LPQQIAEIFGRLDEGFVRTVRNCQLVTLWSEVVDAKIGRNTEAVKITDHTLYVETSSSAWAQELSFLKKTIIARFNDKAGEAAITDIKFKAAGLNTI
jgi:predicted nucleic acid-binding Zn ribbon protein